MHTCLGRLNVALLIGTVLVSCARMEVAQFEPRRGQQSLIRDGVPVVYSRQRDSLALLRPARRQFQAGKPVYVLALYNLTSAPMRFSESTTEAGRGRARLLPRTSGREAQ
jgi:hypothetical protein